jgi:hypothetical protein
MPIEFRTDANVPMAVVEVGRRGQLDSSHAAEGAAQGILAARDLDDASAALALVCTGALRMIGRDPQTGNHLFAPGDEAS